MVCRGRGAAAKNRGGDDEVLVTRSLLEDRTPIFVVVVGGANAGAEKSQV
jgi:hypothetical protein